MPRRRGPPARATAEALLAVGIGASAGGLQPCRQLVAALGDGRGMSFILIQHLDPTHESMMVDLLAGSTKMTVVQATDGMSIRGGHVYVIPPGAALSVGSGALHLSPPQARHGARLPFDFLLHSLAQAYGARAVCVILSGGGADGSLGLRAIKARHGLVIAQDPQEAAHDGMPRSAIGTDAVDLVLPVAGIPAALLRYQRQLAQGGPPDAPLPTVDLFQAIIELLRLRTGHDFTLYKPGTLRRRIERRMGMAGIASAAVADYIDTLRSSRTELDALAGDLLINVTSFFRDPHVFELLAARVIPDLVREHSFDRPLRVWIAGCSTGEEAYSLAMLFREAIAAQQLNVKLQVFASDVDADAVASARDGLYPEASVAAVAPARLERFFTREPGGWRVAAELRA